MVDKLIGGTSLLRGRRDPITLYVGDALDLWRVLEVSAPFRLLLLSEMRLPGKAILEFKICPVGQMQCDSSRLHGFFPGVFLVSSTGIVYAAYIGGFSGECFAPLHARSESQW